MPAPLDVAAGLVFRDGKLLITQRSVGSHLAGLWEFPGGKRELNETFEECLRRELLEELGIEVEVGRLVEDLTHDYPDRSVHLRFFRCRWLRHEPQPLHCEALAWISAHEIFQYEFPAADSRLLERLRSDWPQLQT
jgi:8-oxo-dGTP diphosphatase